MFAKRDFKKNGKRLKEEGDPRRIRGNYIHYYENGRERGEQRNYFEKG